MLVAATLLVIVIGLVLRMTSQTAKAWRDSNSKIQSFQEARAGFEAMTRTLGQATLNTYYDYYDTGRQPRQKTAASNLPNFVPDTYDRISDLHFISGQGKTLLANSNPAIITQTQAVFFQAPLGYSVLYQKLDNALNACGYFLRFDDANAIVPPYYRNSPSYKPRWRWRLMEMIQSTEQLAIYGDPAASPVSGPNDWFVKNAAASSRILAENVIALVILPRLSDRDDDPEKTGLGISIAPNYNYNSRIPLGAASDPDWTGFPGDTFTAHPAEGDPVSSTRHHQLPPLLQVIMVVIDEPSAERLQGNSTQVPAALDLRQAGLFTDAAKLAADLRSLEDICSAKPGNLTGNTHPLAYRVFTSDIMVREAKWSKR